MTDFNCFVGKWPFHPTLFETVEELQKYHEKNGVTGGFVSTLTSVCYRDFFISEQALHEELQGTSYRQIMTVNPEFPACMDAVRYGLEHWDIAGVRVVPGFHGYDLKNENLEVLCKWLAEKRLPLYLTLHLEDDRSCYLVQNVALKKEAIGEFLQTHPDLKVLLCNGGLGEIKGLEQTVLSHPAAFFDMSGLRSPLAPTEQLSEKLKQRMVLGTMSPLLCMKTAMLHLEKENISGQVRTLCTTGADFLR